MGEKTLSAFSLKKTERILKRADFKRLSKYGARIQKDHFLIVYSRNRFGNLRLGVTASRKVGSAVVRNRIKRLVRERFRLSKALFNNSYDIHVIARPGAASLSSQEISQVLEDMFCEIARGYKHEGNTSNTH
ncbi:MAG: ribonuclease P protein component [Deltaproteobacteria bacterium]|nr:ribonuclease P protein component [Deltaproteobacteria bacterium]RLB90604.1 MAG: ribonuclease P protein component [Deltaproteobacteria bacterium]RLB94900.1 MAG: ribonuclease P protein component [Deltaproteobacteria bacterium]RLC11717.1 MAG: ribonuclease P protein component [Deltaproteobacteria bacterium]